MSDERGGVVVHVSDADRVVAMVRNIVNLRSDLDDAVSEAVAHSPSIGS